MNETFELHEFLQVCRRNWRMALGVLLGTVLIFVGAAYVLPKRFKSSSVLTVYTAYFQNPLVKDFLPAVQDATELKAQRESLIRQGLDMDFIERTGDKYRLFIYPK